MYVIRQRVRAREGNAGSVGFRRGRRLWLPSTRPGPFERRISIQASFSLYSTPKASRWHFETCLAAEPAPKDIPHVGEQVLIGAPCLEAPKTAGSYRKPPS